MNQSNRIKITTGANISTGKLEPVKSAGKACKTSHDWFEFLFSVFIVDRNITVALIGKMHGVSVAQHIVFVHCSEHTLSPKYHFIVVCGGAMFGS